MRKKYCQLPIDVQEIPRHNHHRCGKLPMSVVLMLQVHELVSKMVVTTLPTKSRKLVHLGEMVLNRKHKMPKVTFCVVTSKSNE